MDEMIIESKILRGIISKIISKNIKKKIGTDCSISVNSLCITNDGNKTSATISITADIETAQIPKILYKFEII